MEYTDITAPETEYQPSNSQLERSGALRKFNRLYVLAPVGIFGFIFLVSVGFLIYLALYAQDDGTVNTISAYADALMILAIFPLLLLCAVIPGLFIFVSFKVRRQRISPAQSLSRIMWRLEKNLGSLYDMINSLVRATARPFILIQAIFAFIQALARSLASLFR